MGGSRRHREEQGQHQSCRHRSRGNEQRVHPSHQEDFPTLHAHTRQAPATQMNSILSSAREAQITEALLVTTVTTYWCLSGTARILTPATPPVSVHVFSYGYKWSACGQSLELCRWRQTEGSGAVLLKHACSVKYIYSWWNFTVRETSLLLIISEFCESEVLMTVWGLQVVFIKGLWV